ncbi:MAG TPA: NifU family protein [Terracidiphilus sp.]|jgi:Fe-S cluster biogenesis protein NfuA
MHDARREFTRRSDRIEELVSRIESTGDPAMRAVAQELLQAVIELHGVAFERILDAVAELPSGEQALEQVAADDLVSSVLSLHGIHPVDIETRVAAAIEKARLYLKSHGGDVELSAIEDNTVYLHLQGTCGSCSSSTETMKGHVEQAIFNAAPEIVNVVAESMPPVNHAAPEFVILQTT